MGSLINHPTHYNLPGKKECIEQMLEDFGGTVTASFCLANAYKYLYRAGEKCGNSKEDDINKAKWYFNYANDKLDGYIRSKKLIKLYLYIRKALEDL